MAAKGVIKITKSPGFLYVNHKGGVMRVFVTGVKGQLGYDVMNELEKQGLEELVWILMKWISQMPIR